MFKDYIRYTGSLVMIKEVTLNTGGIYLNIHRLICSPVSMKLVNRGTCQIIKKNYAIEKGRLYLRVREQKSGLQVRAGLAQHWGDDLKNDLKALRKSKGLL